MVNLAVQLGKLAADAGVSGVYGEQQDVDGVRLIPVAVTWHGFGAGEDTSAEGGSGGGGGGISAPVGAYVRAGDTIRFQPNIVSLAAVAIPLIWVTGRALARIIRAAKR